MKFIYVLYDTEYFKMTRTLISPKRYLVGTKLTGPDMLEYVIVDLIDIEIDNKWKLETEEV